MTGKRAPAVLGGAIGGVFAICAVGSVACGPTDGPGGGPGPGPAPKIAVSVKDPAAVVLRVERSGGEGGLGGPNAIPDFSLYADRRVVAADRPGQVTSAVLDKATYDRLIAAANDAGLGRPRTLEKPDEPTISDTTNLRFVFAPDGRQRVTYAAGMEYDDADRKRLDALHDRLMDKAPGSDQPYRAERTALLTQNADSGDDDTGIPWPLSGARPIGPAGQKPACQLLGRDDAHLLDLLMEENDSATLWSYGRERFAVDRRPLLPEEKSCDDLEAVQPVATKVPPPASRPKPYDPDPEPCFGIAPATVGRILGSGKAVPEKSDPSCLWKSGDRTLLASVIVLPDTDAAIRAYFDRMLNGDRTLSPSPGIGDDAVRSGFGGGTELIVRDRNALIALRFTGPPGVDLSPVARDVLRGLRPR